ncbi:MAG: BRO family protein [Sulfurimonadaceae bacterium]
MDKQLIITLQEQFNELSNTLENSMIEYWYARDLQKVLGYNSWDKFQNVIQKAKISCENSGVEVEDHFRQVGKMVQIGSEALREIEVYQFN